jgi:hypothetical protein
LPFETEVEPLAPEVVARFNKPEGQDQALMSRLSQQTRAAFRLENTVGSLMSDSALPDANLAQTDPLAVALFDAEDFLAPEEKAYSDRFTGANSYRDIEAIRFRIADEKAAREAMASGPLPEWLIGTVAAVVDPTTVLPMAGPLVKGGRAAVALGSFGRVGVSAAAGAGAQEAILQGTQITRTAEESAASVLGALIVGGVIGSVAGTLGRRELAQLTKTMQDGVRKQVENDITQVLRASSLGDLPPPKAGLFDTTAVGRYLDANNAPNFTLPRNNVVKAADNDILNYVAETQPKLLDDVTRLANEIQKADERISRLEADPTTPVTRMVMPRDQLTIDLMDALAKEGTPAAKNQLADIQESLQPKVTLNRLKRENEDLIAEWEAAETRLAKTIEKTKKAMAEIEASLTPKDRAEAALEIARLQAAFEKELAEGRDPLKLYPQGDPMDWLRGFARFPAEPKAKVADKAKTADSATNIADTPAPKDASSAATGPNAPASEFTARLRSSFKAAEITAELAKIGLAMPSLYMSTSMFETSRRVINRFAYTGLLLDDHFKGARHGDDFETEVKILGEPAMMQMVRNVDTAWSDYKQAVKAGEAPKMTRGQFYDAIGTAMTENDVGAHDIISNAAKSLRLIDKHFADLATEWGVGVFKSPEAVAKKMAGKSHLQRVYHHERIKANPVGWKELVKDYFRRQSDKPIAEDFLDEMADSVTSKILGQPDGRLPGKITVPEGRGSAKERTFDIPDNWRTADGRYGMADFVDRNVVNVMARYIRTMAADVAYQKIMGGDEGIAVVLKELKTERDDMLAALAEKSDAKMSEGQAPKPREIAALEKKNLQIEAMYERDRSTIEALVHRIRGTEPSGALDPRYAGARTVAKVIKNSNIPLFMGSSLISQLPDLGRMVMSEGIMRTFGGLAGHFTDGFKSLKMAKAEGQRAGTINDMLMGGRAGQLADIGDQYTNQSKLEMLSGLIAHKSLVWFGVSPWNTIVKSHASYNGADTLLRRVAAMADGKPLTEVQAAQMRAWGIGDYEVELIAKERELWGENTRGAFFSNADQWKNMEARNAFERALLRYIDGNILTPGATDRPLWTQGPVGSLITQFQGFGFASHTRILVAGLQQRDANALSSMLAMVGLGMMGVALRDLVADGKVKERDTRMWVREGIDRSGVLSHMMNLDTLIGKATGVNLQRTLTGQEAERFQGRSLVGQLGGPTAATIDNTARALRGMADGTMTGADVHAIRKVFPYNTFLGTRWLFDSVEQGIVDQYGLSPRQTPR